MDLTDPRNWKNAIERTPDQYFKTLETLEYLDNPIKFKKPINKLDSSIRTAEFTAAEIIFKNYTKPININQMVTLHKCQKMKLIRKLETRAKRFKKVIVITGDIIEILDKGSDN